MGWGTIFSRTGARAAARRGHGRGSSGTGTGTGTGTGRGRGKGKRKGGDRGVAILMVLAALAILIPFTATFNRDARIDWQSSINASNEVKARNLERGALRLSVLMFEIQRMVFNQKQFRELVGGQMDITMIAPYLMSIFGSTDGAEALGSFVGVDTSALNELAVAEGSFEVRLEAESGKINVNCLAVDDANGDKTKERTVQMLEQLMAPQLYDPMFDEYKSDGERYTRSDVLGAMVDYVDDDRQRYDPVRLRSSSQAERYRYTELYDAYEPRNARMDTIEELNLVQGIDDDWMAAFAGELTVYGNCKVNLNFASARQIAMVLKHHRVAAVQPVREAQRRQKARREAGPVHAADLSRSRRGGRRQPLPKPDPRRSGRSRERRQPQRRQLGRASGRLHRRAGALLPARDHHPSGRRP